MLQMGEASFEVAMLDINDLRSLRHGGWRRMSRDKETVDESVSRKCETIYSFIYIYFRIGVEFINK